MRRILLLGLLVMFATACFGRWKPATPRVLNLGDGALAYQAAMAAVRNGGYLIAEGDPQKGSLVVLAKADQDAEENAPMMAVQDQKRASWISLQVYSDGSLHLTARGYHVKEEKQEMHKKLAQELDALAQRIDQMARSMSQGQAAPGPPGGPPPGPPGPPGPPPGPPGPPPGPPGPPPGPPGPPPGPPGPPPPDAPGPPPPASK